MIIREISYSNLETREIRSKLWSLPDYPRDLTTLSFPFFFQLKNVYSTRLELRPESRLWEPLLATWLVQTTICKQQLQLSIYSSHIVPGFTKTECCLNISWKIRYHTRCSGTITIKFNWVRITGLKNPIGPLTIQRLDKASDLHESVVHSTWSWCKQGWLRLHHHIDCWPTIRVRALCC